MFSEDCTVKNRIGLVIQPTPEELQRAVAEFCDWYNYERYHEAIGNLRPIDVYQGRAEKILRRREQLKRKTIQLRRESNLLTA